MGPCWLQTAKTVHFLHIFFCFIPLAGHLLSFISVGKVLVKAFWIVGLDGRKCRWVAEEDLHRNFRVNLTSFLPFSQGPAFLIDSCSLFWPSLKDPTTVFCNLPVSVRRSKYCLELSITWGRLKISIWPFHSCTIFEAYLINSLWFSEVKFFTYFPS